MNSLAKILEIASRLDHLGTCADWVARETVHSDNSLSQTGTLMAVLVEDVRERVNALVEELESFGISDKTH